VDCFPIFNRRPVLPLSFAIRTFCACFAVIPPSFSALLPPVVFLPGLSLQALYVFLAVTPHGEHSSAQRSRHDDTAYRVMILFFVRVLLKCFLPIILTPYWVQVVRAPPKFLRPGYFHTASFAFSSLVPSLFAVTPLYICCDIANLLFLRHPHCVFFNSSCVLHFVFFLSV